MSTIIIRALNINNTLVLILKKHGQVQYCMTTKFLQQLHNSSPLAVERQSSDTSTLFQCCFCTAGQEDVDTVKLTHSWQRSVFLRFEYVHVFVYLTIKVTNNKEMLYFLCCVLNLKSFIPKKNKKSILNDGSEWKCQSESRNMQKKLDYASQWKAKNCFASLCTQEILADEQISCCAATNKPTRNRLCVCVCVWFAWHSTRCYSAGWCCTLKAHIFTDCFIVQRLLICQWGFTISTSEAL